MKTSSLFSFILVSILCAAPAVNAASSVTIAGWVERVHLDDIDTSFSAKLDTGAKTSSLGATIIKIYDAPHKVRGNKGDAVFSVKDDSGKAYVIKRHITRWVRIKKKGGDFVRRPVVMMAFCLANQRIEEEVNLADRTDFIYPVLIGRNMLAKGRVAVDAGRTFLTKANCGTK